MDRKVVALPEPIEKLPTTETGLMRLYEAIGIFDQTSPVEPHYRTIFFGSARIPMDHPDYQKIRDFGIVLGEHDIDGVTGGGPGSMLAFNAGILEGKKRGRTRCRSYGVSITCYPNEKPNEFLEKEYKHGHYATRLHQFARLGKGRSFVAAPVAGIGTSLEVLWVWQLLQAEQLDGALFVLVGDMWPPLLEWMRTYLLDRKMINARDLELVKIVSTLEDAAPLILKHQARFKQKVAAA